MVNNQHCALAPVSVDCAAEQMLSRCWLQKCPSLRKLVIGGRQPMRLPSLSACPSLQVCLLVCVQLYMQSARRLRGVLAACRWSAAAHSARGMRQAEV